MSKYLVWCKDVSEGHTKAVEIEAGTAQSAARTWLIGDVKKIDRRQESTPRFSSYGSYVVVVDEFDNREIFYYQTHTC